MAREVFEGLEPFYRRVLNGFPGASGSFLYDALEADLTYRLEQEDLRNDPQLSDAVHFRRTEGGVDVCLADLHIYGAKVLGSGASSSEAEYLREDILAFERYLESHLARLDRDYHHCDSQAPENTLAILTGRNGERAIGVRVPQSNDETL